MSTLLECDCGLFLDRSTGWVKEPDGTRYCWPCYEAKMAAAPISRGPRADRTEREQQQDQEREQQRARERREDGARHLERLIEEANAAIPAAQRRMRPYKPRPPKVRWGADVAGGEIIEAKDAVKLQGVKGVTR